VRQRRGRPQRQRQYAPVQTLITKWARESAKLPAALGHVPVEAENPYWT
jgi:hypothetical protein